MAEIHHAAQAGDLRKLRELLAGGADPDATDQTGKTALHWAAMNGHEALAAALLDAGANVNAKDRNGRTPLHWARFTAGICADFTSVGVPLGSAGGGDVAGLLRKHGGK